MKLNKTLIATLAVGGLLALSPALIAADTNTPPSTPPSGAPEMRGRMAPNIDQIAKDYNLTDDQKAKVKTILDDRRQKAHEVMQDTTFSREDKMAKMKTIQEDTATQLKAVPLTQEQVDKLTKPPTRKSRKAKGSDDNSDSSDKPAASSGQ